MELEITRAPVTYVSVYPSEAWTEIRDALAPFAEGDMNICVTSEQVIEVYEGDPRFEQLIDQLKSHTGCDVIFYPV